MKIKRTTRRRLAERVAARSRNIHVGDRVVISPQWGRHIAAGVPATVELIDLQFTRADAKYKKSDFTPNNVEVCLVWGAKPGGGAALRSCEPLHTVVKK